MYKRELVAELRNVLCSTKEADLALDTLMKTIVQTVQKAENVTLVGLGTFNAGKLSARKVRNPQAGEVMNIKATKSPRFTAGKAFKDAVKK
jgi:DNA-binding protein HU-beta